jgi:mxaL protein
MSRLPALLRPLLLAVAVAALGHAAWYRGPPPPALAGVGVVLVFDITQSMLVEDVQVDGRARPRLELAKRAALRVVESLPCGASVGVGVFTQHRSVLLFTPVEICANRAEIVHSIQLVDISMAWSGNSEVAKAYHASLAITKELPGDPALVFITDGHEAPPVNPRHRPAFHGKAGEVRAMVAGIGGTLPVPIPKRDPTGRPVGYWSADEVMQLDPFQAPRTAGSRDMLVETGEASADDLRAAGTPGSEHLSSLRSDYLQLLASETGATYRSLRAETDLPRAVQALLSISLDKVPLPTRRIAMFIALAATIGFYVLGLLAQARLPRPALLHRAALSPSTAKRGGSARSAAPDRTAGAGGRGAGRDLRTSR